MPEVPPPSTLFTYAFPFYNAFPCQSSCTLSPLHHLSIPLINRAKAMRTLRITEDHLWTLNSYKKIPFFALLCSYILSPLHLWSSGFAKLVRGKIRLEQKIPRIFFPSFLKFTIIINSLFMLGIILKRVLAPELCWHCHHSLRWVLFLHHSSRCQPTWTMLAGLRELAVSFLPRLWQWKKIWWCFRWLLAL